MIQHQWVQKPLHSCAAGLFVAAELSPTYRLHPSQIVTDFRKALRQRGQLRDASVMRCGGGGAGSASPRIRITADSVIELLTRLGRCSLVGSGINITAWQRGHRAIFPAKEFLARMLCPCGQWN